MRELYKEEQPQLEISPMVNCPMRCKLCPQDIFLKNYTGKYQLSFEEFKMVIDKIPLNVVITFSGMGEPWLNKDCTKMVLYAYNTGHTHIRIYTTGAGLTTEDIDKIIHIPFDMFQLHIPDIYGYTKMPNHQPYFDMLAKLSVSRKFIKDFRVTAFGDKFDKNLLRLFPDILPLHAYNRAGAIGIIGPFTRITGKIRCGLYTKINHFVMLPNGEVVLCCMDWKLKHKLGNLFTDDYKDLFKSGEYEKIIKGFNDDSIDIACRYCTWGMKSYHELNPPNITIKIKGEKNGEKK